MKYLNRIHRRTRRGGGGGGARGLPPPPPRIFEMAIFGKTKKVIFGQKHLIFGQALEKIFGQKTSSPPPPPTNETGPVRLYYDCIKPNLYNLIFILSMAYCKTPQLGVLKRNKVIYMHDSKLWNCWIHCYNATFDWHIYNPLLKASVHTLLANKDIKRKFGLRFCFLFLNWKVFNSKTLQYSFNVRSYLQRKFHGDQQFLQLR